MLAEHLGGLREFIQGKDNWQVSQDKGGYWFITHSLSNYDPEKVYMTEEVATKIVSMLNNGEYTL